MKSPEEERAYASENLLMRPKGASPDEDSLDNKDEDENQERRHWDKKVEYLLSTIGYCVGLGNIWRFPYVCMRNGGGAFLIPFFLCLFLTALPLYFLESALGQFNGRSCFHVWDICPLFKGIGISMNVLSLYFVWFYGIILGWTLIYLGHSFKHPLPWTVCDESWNSPNCISTEGKVLNASASENSSLLSTMTSPLIGNVTNKTLQVSSTEEFWINNVLQRSPGIEDMGGLPWHTTFAMVMANLCILFAVIKGIRSTGKVVYVTATLPYILLTVILILGVTLPGSGDGMLFYIKPDFSKLLSSDTWIDAFMQVFYSLGPGWGALITMSSYNKFHNNCMRDSIMLTICCEGTSIFGGFAIFSILGHMAHVQGVSISSFTKSGAGLAFIVYPAAISYLPLPQLWGFLFFLMLFTLGLDSQFAAIETFMTSVNDLGIRLVSKWKKTSITVIMGLITIASLPFASRGGVYIFSLIDWYIAAFSMLIQTSLELLVVAWIYGTDRFSRDIELMLGRRPYPIFIFSWRFLSPAILLIVLGVTLAKFKPAQYDGIVFADLFQNIGWLFSAVPFFCIVLYAVYELTKHKGSLWTRVKSACRPSQEWGPAMPAVREKYMVDLAPLDDSQRNSCKSLCCGAV